MAPLPEDVAQLVVRGVGAYIRAVPVAGLPPKLKRFKSLDRPRALAPHKDALLKVLDEDRVARARISEWMADGRPALAKRERDALALAVDRPDGWAESLHALSEKEDIPAGDEPPSQGDALARARERADRARDDLRRAREEVRKARSEAAAAVAEARESAGRLERELQEARAEGRRLRAALAEADKRSAASQRAAERAERKLRSDREKAAEREKALRAELKELRRDLRAERERAERRMHAQRDESRPRPPAEATPRPRARRPLPVPKGRFETDPETLDEWLDAAGVHLLVDGYNVAKAEGGFGDADLPTQRRRLVEGVGKVVRRKKITATIVFDGSEVAPGTSRRPRGPVTVEYSRPGEIADDHLIARLETLAGGPVVVATNDKELQGRAAALGATVATSNQLLALIR